MKKRFLGGLLSISMAAVMLAGCGSSGGNYSSEAYIKDAYYSESLAPTYAPVPNGMKDYNYNSKGESYAEIDGGTATIGSAGSNVNTGAGEIQQTETSTQRKVIKTASLRVQTLEFDQYLSSLDQVLMQYNAYIENSSISGNEYYDSAARFANFTIRVAEGNLKDLLAAVGDLGTVVSKSYNEQDITLSYVDVESRIRTLRSEQETLLRFMNEATDIYAIIEIEQRLSEVNYELERYTSQLKTYDNKVELATISLSVSEVNRITPVTPVKQTFGERISEGFFEGLEDFIYGMQNFAVWFVSNVFGIAIFLIIVFLIVLLCTAPIRKKKKARAKAEKQMAQPQYAQPQVQAQYAQPAQMQVQPMANQVQQNQNQPVQNQGQQENNNNQ